MSMSFFPDSIQKHLTLGNFVAPWVALVVLNAVFHVTLGSRWTIEVFQNKLLETVTPWAFVNTTDVIPNPFPGSPQKIFPFTPIWHDLYELFIPHRFSLVVHVVSNSLAIVTGFVQMKMEKKGQRHRLLGYTYAVSFTVGALSGIFLGSKDIVGKFGPLNFALMGLTAIFSTWGGIFHAVQGNYALHQEWMKYSYNVCISVSTWLRLSFLFLIPLLAPAPHPSKDVEFWYMIFVFLSWAVPTLYFFAAPQSTHSKSA